jgi:hypothetical protein
MLVRRHLSIAGNRGGHVSKPDESLLEDVVAPRVLEALRLSRAALRAAGIRHVVIGGLAVGAHGYPRNTRDVDFLVGPEAFVQHASGIVTLAPAVPFQANGVAIDYLSPTAEEGFLAGLLDGPPGAMVGAPALIYLKLKSPRHKDRTDVIELIKAGIDVEVCRAYLAENAPGYLPAFDEAFARAQLEAEDA